LVLGHPSHAVIPKIYTGINLNGIHFAFASYGKNKINYIINSVLAAG
jgi:hypothetical protein